MIEDNVEVTVTNVIDTINIFPSITDEVVDINILDNREDVNINVTESVVEVNINKVTNILSAVWGEITGTLSDQTDLQSALNDKQDDITLTVTGSSGASTFIGNTLNVPTYSLTGLGGVPTSRTLSINGTSYDLSANRSWSVGTVTAVTANSPLSSSGGATPAISIQVASGSQNGYLSSTDWTTFNSKIGGSGTTNYIPKFNGSGTSITNSLIYDNGTNVGIGTTAPAHKLHIYSTSFNLLRLQRSTVSDYSLSLGGAGELYFVNELNSTYPITILNSGNVGIGTTAPAFKLDVNGTSGFTGAATFSNSVTSGAFMTNATNGSGGQEAIRINNDNGYIGFFNGANNVRSGYLQGNTTDLTLTTSLSTPLIFGIANSEKMRISSAGNVGIGTTSPAASSLLDVTSTTQGFLPPRMTNTQRLAISSPAVGLVVFVTTTIEQGLWVYHSTGWVNYNLI